MLIFDVLDDRIPAVFVVDEISVTRRIDNVQSKSDVVLLNDMRNCLNVGRLSNRFIWFEPSLGID